MSLKILICLIRRKLFVALLTFLRPEQFDFIFSPKPELSQKEKKKPKDIADLHLHFMSESSAGFLVLGFCFLRLGTLCIVEPMPEWAQV
jgi:hypothetical protein